MERLDFITDKYSPVEATIHMTRYLNAFPFIAGKHVLDVACGEGYGSALMKRWGARSVTGVDISSDAIRKAKELFSDDDLVFIEHNAERLPFDDVSFDMAVSLETIEHLDNPEAFLSELRRVVKAGGTIIVSCPNDQYYAENVPDFSNPYHKRRYSFFDFRQMAERILGETGNWYLGNSLAGFFNMPLKQENYPESGVPESPENMLAMMDAEKLHNVFVVPPDKYLNSWNSLYYVGIWGDKEKQVEACVYPTPHFFLYQNKSVPDSMKLAKEYQETLKLLELRCQDLSATLSDHEELKQANEEATELVRSQQEALRALKEDNERISATLSDYEELKQANEEATELTRNQQEELQTLKEETERLSSTLRDYEKLKQDYQTLFDAQEHTLEEYEKIKEEHRVLINERDRLCLLNDMQKKEESILWDLVHRLRGENSQIHEHINEQEGQLRELQDKNTLLFDEHLKYFGLIEAYEKQQNWIAEMQKSRGWRFLEFVRRVLRFLRLKKD